MKDNNFRISINRYFTNFPEHCVKNKATAMAQNLWSSRSYLRTFILLLLDIILLFAFIATCIYIIYVILVENKLYLDLQKERFPMF